MFFEIATHEFENRMSRLI